MFLQHPVRNRWWGRLLLPSPPPPPPPPQKLRRQLYLRLLLNIWSLQGFWHFVRDACRRR